MKKIFQIWISNSEIIPKFITDNISKIKKLYPECEHNLYTNEKIKKFLLENFELDVFLAYEKCKPYAFKSDLVRYCLLYTYGGYYFDVSICPEFKLIHDYDSFAMKGEDVEVSGITYSLMDNGVMYFKQPNHIFLEQAIKKSVSNILSHNYGNHPLDITGPAMLYQLNHSEIKLHQCSKINNKKVIVVDDKIWIKYAKGFSKMNNEENKKLGTNNYADMWFNKCVFKGAPKL
jgi:mannosyltransferase OCH1-like enzyme